MSKGAIKFKKLSDNVKSPTYATNGSNCVDLVATHFIGSESSEMVIGPGEKVMIGTGIAIELPVGKAALIFARSGLASKKGLAPANKVGVIDSDYRGELIVALRNYSNNTEVVSLGERVAQLGIVDMPQCIFEEVSELSDTDRGLGGFGSTGN